MRLQLTFLFLAATLSGYAQLPKLIIPKGHTNPVVALQPDKDGRYLYSTDGGQEITVWDISTREIVTFLDGHSSFTTSLSLSADGKHIASGDAAGGFIIRGQSDWKVSHVAELKSGILNVGFSPNSKKVAALTQSGILTILTANNWQTEKIVEKSGVKISSFAWNSEGELAVGLANGSVEVNGVSLAITDKAITGIINGKEPNSWIAVTGSGELFNLSGGALLSQAKTPLPRLISVVPANDFFIVTGRGSAANFNIFSKETGAEMTSKLSIPDDIASQSGVALGLQTSAVSADSKFIYLPDYEGGIAAYDMATGALNARYSGLASKIYSLAVNADGAQLAVGSGSGVVLFDLTGASDPKRLKNITAPVIGLDFGTNKNMLAGVQQNGLLNAWDTKYDAVVYSRATDEKLTYPYLMVTPDDETIIKKVDNGTGIFPVKTGKKPKVIKLKESFDQRLTTDGKTLLVQDADNGIVSYETTSFKKQSTTKVDGLQYFELSGDGRWIAAVVRKPEVSIQLVDRTTGKVAKEIKVPATKSITKLQFDPTGQYLLTLSNVSGKGSNTGDYGITFWDLQKGEEAFQLKGHTAAVSALAFANDGKVLFSSGFDGLIKCWSVTEKKELATLVPLGKEEWAVVTLEGLFDASTEAVYKMHYTYGKEPIALEQMKDKFYEPYLLPKLLGFHQEPIRQAPKLEGFNIYPEIKLAHPLQNDGKLGISLNDQGGGIGRIVILINGKEVINDARGQTNTTSGFASLDYGIENHPYIKKGSLNKITVKAYNSDGYLSSPEKSVYLIDEDKGNDGVAPKVFGLVAGVSDYQGTDMDLKYAAKDAEDFYKALKLSTEGRFGKENVSLQLLTTLPGQQAPTKKNITETLEKIKNTATSNDYLVVYLSGHGITETGEGGDFYYLTADASSMKVSDISDKAAFTLSSSEIGQLVMQVPTIRQVLVIDACHSGQLAQNLTGSNFAMSSEQVRALETLKDRTGLYIIAGSAADAVSYEASAFDQGLLTYSLLYGMKGPALRDERYIDIIDLFNFASKKVPELASEIGGVQKPEVRVPHDLNSFDIGELGPEERGQITLKASRPAVSASAFQNEATFSDDLQLGELIDQRLKKLESENTEQGVMFVDAKTFPEAYVLRGRYTEEGETIIAKGAVFQGKKKLADIEATSTEAAALADMLLAKISEFIK